VLPVAARESCVIRFYHVRHHPATVALACPCSRRPLPVRSSPCFAKVIISWYIGTCRVRAPSGSCCVPHLSPAHGAAHRSQRRPARPRPCSHGPHNRNLCLHSVCDFIVFHASCFFSQSRQILSRRAAGTGHVRHRCDGRRRCPPPPSPLRARALQLTCGATLIHHCAGVVTFVLAWFGLPLALPPQFTIMSLLPLVCFVFIFLYGCKAIDFYYTRHVVVKPVLSTRALVAISLCFCVLVVLALAYSPRLQAPPFSSANIIRWDFVLPVLP
jgi:hypothetical protein